MSLVHVGLNLEHKSGKIRRKGVDFRSLRFPGQGRRRHAEEILQERFYPEIGKSGTEKYRRQFTVTDPLHVEFVPRTVQQLHVVPQDGGVLRAQQSFQAGGVPDIHFGGLHFPLAVSIALESDDLAPGPVIYAFEFFSGTDGPVYRIGLDP